jgi:divinyl protochlorophyllide a 8-vinyl-reductase
MSPAQATARIGPNAITQLASALDAAVGREATEGLFLSAGLAAYLRDPPRQMVAESEVIALHTAVRQALPPALLREVSCAAGSATGDYLLRHRIPAAAQRVLRLLPRRLASHLLLRAIGRHAWTFAGSGSLAVRYGRSPVICLQGCPICRDLQVDAPACEYFRATFERLFRALVSGSSRVIESDCAAAGAPQCRFRIAL